MASKSRDQTTITDYASLNEALMAEEEAHRGSGARIAATLYAEAIKRKYNRSGRTFSVTHAGKVYTAQGFRAPGGQTAILYYLNSYPRSILALVW